MQIANLLNGLGYETHIYQYAPTKFTRKIGDIYIHSLTSSKLTHGCFSSEICNEFYEATKLFDKVIIALPEFTGGKMREDVILITQGALWCQYYPNQTLSKEQKNYLYKGWSNARTNIIVHEFTRDVVRSLGFDDIADKMFCIDNYIDTNIFKPREEKQKRILFPGRAELVKGTDLVEGVIENINNKEWTIMWCGPGSQFAMLKRLENKYSNFLATTSSFDNMPSVYGQSEICVVINTASRGNSLTLMESMASGCACIGIENNNTLIRDGINGILCQPNEESISNAINKLIQDDALREKLGKQARIDIIRKYPFSKWHRKWCKVL